MCIVGISITSGFVKKQKQKNCATIYRSASENLCMWICVNTFRLSNTRSLWSCSPGPALRKESHLCHLSLELSKKSIHSTELWWWPDCREAFRRGRGDGMENKSCHGLSLLPFVRKKVVTVKCFLLRFFRHEKVFWQNC
jgi:hypothetical protein